MKQKLLSALFLICAIAFRAQTVTPTLLSNNGGYSSLSGGSISWSIGEPVSETYTTATNITTMGFHQPELNIITLINEQGSDKNILVFPNPVKDEVSVSFTGLTAGNYKLDLLDNLGKIIYQSQTEINSTNQEYKLKLGEIAAGNYFLRIEGKDFSKSVKIIKVN